MRSVVFTSLIVLAAGCALGVNRHHAAVVARLNATAPPCETVAMAEANTGYGVYYDINYANEVVYGTQFVAPSNMDVCAVSIYGGEVGTAAMTVTIKIYSDGGDDLSAGSELGTSQAFSAADFPASPGWVTQALDSAVSLTASTKYWVVCVSSVHSFPSDHWKWGAAFDGVTERLWNGTSVAASAEKATNVTTLFKLLTE